MGTRQSRVWRSEGAQLVWGPGRWGWGPCWSGWPLPRPRRRAEVGQVPGVALSTPASRPDQLLGVSGMKWMDWEGMLGQWVGRQKWGPWSGGSLEHPSWVLPWDCQAKWQGKRWRTLPSAPGEARGRGNKPGVLAPSGSGQAQGWGEQRGGWDRCVGDGEAGGLQKVKLSLPQRLPITRTSVAPGWGASPSAWRGCGRGGLSHRVACVMTGYIYSWVGEKALWLWVTPVPRKAWPRLLPLPSSAPLTPWGQPCSPP